MPPQQPSRSCRAMTQSAQRRKRGPPHGPGGTARAADQGPSLVGVHGLVEAVEDLRPRVAGAVLRSDAGAQFRDAERQLADRALRGDDRQRDDRLPGPAAPVVDVEREPGRQVDQLRRDDRQVVPGPLAEHGHPDPGEDAARLQTALGADPFGGARHVRRGRLVAGQPQRDVGLDAGRQVAGAAVEVGPGGVVTLLRADPARLGGGVHGVPGPEELAHQQVLGVHGDVGLELALPPALLVLQAEQVITGAREGLAGRVARRARRTRRAHRAAVRHLAARVRDRHTALSFLPCEPADPREPRASAPVLAPVLPGDEAPSVAVSASASPVARLAAITTAGP